MKVTLLNKTSNSFFTLNKCLEVVVFENNIRLIDQASDTAFYPTDAYRFLSAMED